ncbi:MAG: pyridoxamine 5'-phosphate oxidase family protein, partial [Pirellulales bacterium]
KTLIYPGYRGNGVYASLGNMSENPHVGILFIDFFDSTIGLHVNGKALVVDNERMMQRVNAQETVCAAMQVVDGPHPERWVQVNVEEAYIHCAKHVPRLAKVEKKIHWGSDDESYKGGRFFDVPK